MSVNVSVNARPVRAAAAATALGPTARGARRVHVHVYVDVYLHVRVGVCTWGRARGCVTCTWVLVGACVWAVGRGPYTEPLDDFLASVAEVGPPGGQPLRRLDRQPLRL